MRTLNGWQRLWVVFAVTTFLFAAGYMLYEAGEFLSPERLVYRAVKDPDCVPVWKLPTNLDPSLKQTFIPKMECSDLYDYLQTRSNPPRDAQAFLDEFEKRRKDLLASGVLVYGALWLVTVFAVYGLGLLVRWVRRGFSQSQRNG